jgi:hypothetical protein
MKKAGALPPGGWGRLAAFAGLVVLAVALRAVHLGWPPLWADEAESGLNALTIVGQGVPLDRYRDLPIFENTLIRPWPESEEYAFRDISYSDRGLAIYHGWLPLYAMAGAFRIAGVTPESARQGPPLRGASTAEFERWTAVPRWTAIAFSAALVLLSFALGRTLAGEGAGWAMALAVSVSNLYVHLGRQARYYSPTLALTAACGLAIWAALRRGRLRDYALAGLAVGFLFHTHALSAVVAALLFVAALPLARGQDRLAPRVALAGGVGGLIVLPWAWWSGLLAQSVHIPAARDFLGPRSLVQSLPSTDPVVFLVSVLGLSWLALGHLAGTRMPERWRRPILDSAPALCFAAGWTALSYLVFVALVPAASYWPMRLKLSVAVPGLLLIAVVVSALSRVFRQSVSVSLPAALMLGLLAVVGQLRLSPVEPGWDGGTRDVVRLVRSWDLGPSARVYATPNEHLVLTYYTGLPVQSLNAVRGSWLDRFDHDLVIIDAPRYEEIPRSRVAKIAARHGLSLSSEESSRRARAAQVTATAQDVEPGVAGVEPRPLRLDPFERELVEETRALTRRAIVAATRGTPMARAGASANWKELWEFFFLRFADRGTTARQQASVAARLERSRAHVLPGGWVVYDCRPHRSPPLVAGEATSGALGGERRPASSP